MDKHKVIEEAEACLTGDLFLVEVVVSPANEVEVIVDGDGSVSIDQCVALSRALEQRFDREQEDFELTVSSAGIGRPLKLLRQYKKLLGKPVEVVLKDGRKVIGDLDKADESGIGVSYEAMELPEGEKRKKKVRKTVSAPWDEIKSTVEHLDFK